MSFCIRKGQKVRLCYDRAETEAVKTAIGNLEQDLKKVFPGVEVVRAKQDFAWKEDTGRKEGTEWKEDTEPKEDGDRKEQEEAGQGAVVVIRTVASRCRPGCAGSAPEAFKELESFSVSEKDNRELEDEEGILHKETYQLKVKRGVLYITGADRRGTIYGIYTFCEQMGVSPWYFFADVPVRQREEIVLEEGYCRRDWPSVEYRGIFINDEEELEAWVKNYMGEATIGVKSYEKIFELLLRLKANYIWPAMHVNSFNLTPENGALAERMGIVVGTSHCDMLMRSNNREWKPWIQKKGYRDAVYDYSIEGRNRDILKEYWWESVEQNQDYEVCYTLGMRGIHDSGFETRNLEGKTEEEIRNAKISLLETIITDQREILKNTLGRETMTTFIPYKEVLELYDNGLKVPEDMTLVWANDNYGYIRRYPSEAEKKRRGGNGIYYHNSYWSPPSMSYVFLCSIPLAHTRNELQKAWNEGIRKLWVLNSGAMKPLEQEITFFLRLAWEIGKPGALTENVEAFVEEWINHTFSGGIGKKVSSLLNDFSQLTNVRKIENMDYDAFSQTAYGDEAVVRIHRYEGLFVKGNALYERLPDEEKDAFFQLVLMRIHAAYFTNLAYYYGDRSTLMYDRGNMQGAALYTKRSGEAQDARTRMLHYYNHVMCGGKWKGILNPEGFPPPRAAMMPVCTPPLKIEGEPAMRVDVWNEEKEICFATPGEKWIEIGNQGKGRFEVSLSAPAWAELSENHGVVSEEKRILVRVEDVSRERQGEILVENLSDGSFWRIPVRTVKTEGMQEREDGSVPEKKRCALKEGRCAVEEDGLVVLEAEAARAAALQSGDFSRGESCPTSGGCEKLKSAGFRMIPRLGRLQGSVAEACVQREPEEITDEGALCFDFITLSQGEFLLEIHRFPSLNSVGRIRIGVSLDEGPVQIAESKSNDEWRGNWKKNVLNNVDRLYLNLPAVSPGRHRLYLWAVDRYFAFSRLVIYTKPRKENNLAGIRGEQALPSEWEITQWCREFYGDYDLKPRPVFYAGPEEGSDCLDVACRETLAERFGARVEPAFYLNQGQGRFMEKDGKIRIDAASVLARSKFAWMEDGSTKKGGLWRHCSSESYGRSGLAMYIREPGLRWQAKEAPGLYYRIHCTGGDYRLWMLSKFNVIEECFFGVGIDGEILPEERLYERGSLWRYEAEQIYRWVPICLLRLEAGEHVLSVYALASGMRYDRFYLTKGGELPPGDVEWSE